MLPKLERRAERMSERESRRQRERVSELEMEGRGQAKSGVMKKAEGNAKKGGEKKKSGEDGGTEEATSSNLFLPPRWCTQALVHTAEERGA